MVYLIGFIGVIMLSDASDSLDKHVNPSSVIEAAVGGVLLLAALIGWFLRRG